MITSLAASIGEVMLVALWLSAALVAGCVGSALLVVGLGALYRTRRAGAGSAGGATRHPGAPPLRPVPPDRTEGLAGITPGA